MGGGLGETVERLYTSASMVTTILRDNARRVNRANSGP